MSRTYGDIHKALSEAIPQLARPVELPEGWAWSDWEEATDGMYVQAWIWAGKEWTEGVKRSGCTVTIQDIENNPSVKARLNLSEAQIEVALMCLQDATV